MTKKKRKSSRKLNNDRNSRYFKQASVWSKTSDRKLVSNNHYTKEEVKDEAK